MMAAVSAVRARSLDTIATAAGAWSDSCAAAWAACSRPAGVELPAR